MIDHAEMISYEEMIDHEEIATSLASLNGNYFKIANLNDYAKKLAEFGKSISLRQKSNNKLVSYVLYYDNGPEIFISMVWTHPDFQGRGYAKRLLRQLIHSSDMDIKLEVHKSNPAGHLYADLGFTQTGQVGDIRSMVLHKKIAIMQPYVFPYIGYFHLIDACNLFVFYDDVQFIPRGWINRNRILLNQNDYLFTVPVSKVSQNRLINETRLAIDNKWIDKFKKTLTLSYQKAPFFHEVCPLIMSVFSGSYCSVSDLAINSIVSVYDYLGMPFNYTLSSICSNETRGMNKADRLIAITKNQGYKGYVNASGGQELYSKEYFKLNGIDLGFIESHQVKYRQFLREFIPQLSIIDVMMFNDVETIKELISQYKIR